MYGLTKKQKRILDEYRYVPNIKELPLEVYRKLEEINDWERIYQEVDMYLRDNFDIKAHKPSREIPKGLKILDKEPVEVANQSSGESVVLPPDAVAVYDWIKGSELFKQYDDMQKGLDWFREHEPKAYMVLLD
jgi:hypothetical protein